jgi:hypothetical protein
MAWRLNDSVVSGTIDNREKGKVRGQLWLVQRAAPIRFELNGDCASDLAGCVVEFVNPNPKPIESFPQIEDQIGEAGYITGSRRVAKVPDGTDTLTLTKEQVDNFPKTNLLYLEWFSERNGRVVVEILDPQIKISEPAWAFAPGDQPENDGQCIVGFVQKMDMDDGEGSGKPFDEFQYEKMLRKFDDYVARFEDSWERHKDDPEADQKIADELGLTIIPDDSENELSDYLSEILDEALAGGPESGKEPGGSGHPLVDRALKLCVSVETFAGSQSDEILFAGNFERICFSSLEALAKLANALTGGGNPEAGLVVALLKRAIEQYHDALEALDDAPEIPGHLQEQWRAEILEIRQDILSEMNAQRI